jgi:methyl-accepting chemotaxis protein
MLYWILGIFVALLIFYSLRRPVIEGLDTSPDTTGNQACDASLVSFQNAGSIQSLKDTVNKLADQVTSLQKTQTSNTAAIEELQAQATKFGDLAEQAEELATQNKDRLMQLAQESQQKISDAKDSLSSIPDIQPASGTDSTTK